MSRQWTILAVVISFAMGLVASCSDASQEDSTSLPAGQPRAPAARELPTLYPTGTLPPTPTLADTRLPEPTQLPATEVSFSQLAVDITYSIPALELERRIRGNVAGEIEVIDENGGSSITLKNRPGVIVEMQQALPNAVIEELPADCDSCVQVTYELPLTDQSGEGWLNDVQLLASVENYMASILGPHFPPDTVMGLRREATPFEVAHSVAITADGQLWTWKATDAKIDDPVVDKGILERASRDLDLVDWEVVPDSVGHFCYEGGGREWLMLDRPGSPELIEIRCPELYLPGQLVPLYRLLSEAVGEKLEGSEVGPPELPMTLDTLLMYGRSDGVRLTITNSGHLAAIDGDDSFYTSTITATQVVSITNLVLSDSLLEPGPSTLFDQGAGNVILLRAVDGVYEIAWSDESERPNLVADILDNLIELVVEGTSVEEVETPEPAPDDLESDGS